MSRENVEIVRKLIVAFQEGLERGDPGRLMTWAGSRLTPSG